MPYTQEKDLDRQVLSSLRAGVGQGATIDPDSQKISAGRAVGDESGVADTSSRNAGVIVERLEASVSRRVDMVSAFEDSHGRAYEGRTSAVGIAEDEEDIMFA